jgi:ABC-type dipeptide/oligopeptide/nickel transport system permease component
MLRTLNEDFTLMAKAYGHRRSVSTTLRAQNSLISAVSVSDSRPTISWGDVLVEAVFDWPGSGCTRHGHPSVDYAPVIGGAAGAAVYAVVNLITDLLCGALDPGFAIGR